AEGLVKELIDGRTFTYQDLKERTATWFDTSIVKIESRKDLGIPIYIAAQKAIETALAGEARAFLNSQYEKDTTLVADKFNQLYMRRPVVPYSEIKRIIVNDSVLLPTETPPSITKLISDFTTQLEPNSKLVIPFASSGNALPLLREDLNVTVYSHKTESGLARFGTPTSLASSAKFVSSDLFRGAIESNSSDAVVLVAPTGLMEKTQIIDGVSTIRYDHKLALEMLRPLKNDGNALIIINGDGIKHLGQVVPESKQFHEHLFQHFNVINFIDIDGSITASSVNSSLRAYVIRGRKPIPQLDIELPLETTVLHNHDQVINWSSSISESKFDFKDTNNLSINLSDEEIKINEFQAKYVPVCDLGDPSSMIPKNLATPTRQGFIRFLNDHSDITQFVSDNLQMSIPSMSQCFTPEQIDALGLAIWRNQSNLGFLNGDDMGEGKGRVVAAMLRYHVLNNKLAIFLTSKDTLFQDIWRDIKAIGSESIFTPFLVNEKSEILDDNGVPLFKASKRTLDKLIEDKLPPKNANLIMATYSQLSRKTKYQEVNGYKTAIPDKSSWLQTCSTDAFVAIDESHLAAGASNTHVRVREMLNRSSNVLYSSGTWAKSEKNYGIYFKLMRGIEPSAIEKAVAKGGDVLLEIFASSLASDGGFIRREKNLSGIDIEPTNDENNTLNIQLSDAFAEAVQGISILTGNIDRVINNKNEVLAKQLESQLPANTRKRINLREIGLNTTGFGSQLVNISKQFILSLNCEQAAKEALSALGDNKKPFVAIEFNGDAFIRLLYKRQLKMIETGKAQDLTFQDAPQFRELLHIILDNSLNITERNSSKKKSLNYQSILAGQELVNFETTLKAVRQSIDNFPDLPFMPIDYIRHQIEDKNYSFGEITGRKIRIDKNSDGTYRFVPFEQEKRLVVRNAFNNGELDVLLGTKPVVDGISLHSDSSFNDTRQRVLIEAEVFRNVVDRIQLLGRVSRRGQVIEPIIKTLGCGLPAQERCNAMSNAALMRMSANVTSNRDSGLYLDTVNLLNSEGDLVCQKYLESNPDYIHKLGMNHNDVYVTNITQSSVNSLSRKLTGRLILLPYEEQEKVYQELSTEYNSRIIDLTNRGINPLNPKHLNIQAVETNRLLYKGSEKSHYNSVFDQPITLVELDYQESVTPWDSDAILDKMDHSQRWLSKDPRLTDGSLTSFVTLLNKNTEDLLTQAADGDKNKVDVVLTDLHNRKVSAKSGTVYTPLTHSLFNEAILRLNTRLEFLKEILPKIQLGTIISLPPSFYSDFEIKGDSVVVNIRVPKPGSEHNPSQYFVELISPGDSETIQISLDQFYYAHDTEMVNASVFDETHELSAEFDSYQKGTINRSAITMEGNLFLAALEASEQGLGSPITYTTNEGVTRQAIMLRHDISVHDMLNKPVILHKANVAADYLRNHPRVFMSTSSVRLDPGYLSITMSQSKDRYRLTFPQKAKYYKPLIGSNHLMDALNQRPIDETRNYKSVDVFENEIDNVIKALYKHGVVFQTDNTGLDWINRYESNQVSIISPLLNPMQHSSHALNHC
ncbi:MAG: hypothetical protein HAW67_00740, partial [Endozoicomonadaceae bacterium]|nr:hypothetical protein [Endozoicomonadaceae bacterium]